MEKNAFLYIRRIAGVIGFIGAFDNIDIKPASLFKFLHAKCVFLKYSATLTKPINTGTSTSGPITAANAAPELMPKTATATAMASSKLLLAAVNESVAVLG